MGEVIDHETKEYGIDVFEKVSVLYDCPDKIETFITHVVMAISRIKSGNIMHCDFVEVETDIKNEVGEPQFEKSKSLATSLLETSPVEFPKEEFAFVLLHLNAIMAS